MVFAFRTGPTSGDPPEDTGTAACETIDKPLHPTVPDQRRATMNWAAELVQVGNKRIDAYMRLMRPDTIIGPRGSIMATYQGKQVTVLRPAKEGDPGFGESTDQVVIKLEDGTLKTVDLSEVDGKDDKQQQP